MKAKDEIALTLANLAPRDWPWLEKFLRSPYHTTDERMPALLQQFRLAKSNDFELDAKRVFRLVFTKKTFSSRDWGDLLRKFLTLLRSFLWQQQARQQPIFTAPAAIQATNNYYLYPTLEEQISGYEKQVADHRLPPWEVAYLRRYLHQKRYESLVGERELEHLQLAGEQLDIHFLLLRLRYSIEFTFEPAKQTNTWDVSVLLLMANHYAVSYPLLGFYADMYRTFAERNYAPARVLALEKRYYTLFPILEAEDQAFFFVKLCTLFNRALLTSTTKFRAEQFRLFQFGVAEDLLLQNNKLYELTYFNICITAVAEQQLEWATAFKKKYLQHLATDNANNADLFSEALIDFGYGRYGRAFRALGLLKRPDISLSVQVQILQTKCLVERYVANDLRKSVLVFRLDAHYRFVYRNPINEQTKEALYAGIRLLRLLVRLREKRGSASEMRTHLLQALADSPNIMAREWLASVFTNLK